MALTTRPYLRSALARAVYDRVVKDNELHNYDKNQWYECDMKEIPENLRELYLPCHCDSETEAFLDICYEKADWIFTRLFQAIARPVLCFFMTSTSANGLLGRGSMFVFSRSQFLNLLGITDEWKSQTLLDLGAGDGKVTDIMAPFFHTVHVTEISPVMRKVLTKKKYRVIDADKWMHGTTQYDVIGCLNLLDRCDRPLTLLSHIRSKLRPGTGLLIVALVLPLCQYVETGKPDHRPSERLPVEGSTFESQLVSFWHNVLEPYGFEVVRWTRLPYLCEGDVDQSFYWLDDVVFVLRLKNQDQA